MALVATSAMSYGQGTIAFGNTIASRVKYVSAPGAAAIDMPTSVRANFGVFFSTSSANDLQLNPGGALGVSSTSSAGIITAAGTYAINGGPELATDRKSVV